jgi:hypothetical protein
MLNVTNREKKKEPVNHSSSRLPRDISANVRIKVLCPNQGKSRAELLSSPSGIVRTTESASPQLKKFNILKK